MLRMMAPPASSARLLSGTSSPIMPSGISTSCIVVRSPS